MFLTKKNTLNWRAIVIGIIVTLVLVFCGILWFDIPVYNFLHRFDWKIWHVLDVVFSVKTWLVVSLIFVTAFYIKKIISTKSKLSLSGFYDKVRNSYAFSIFCSVFLASVFGGTLKLVIGRMRPIFYAALNMTGFFPFTTDWAFQSMPSGHAMASFAGLVTIGLIAPRAKWFTWSLAIVIGFSRLCIGVHWASDVILGAFIGMIAADVVRAMLVRTSRK